MKKLHNLLENNRIWANDVSTKDPEFFESLAKQQSPDYLWIGCADSRVPANEIVNMLPGELFVHRNVANVVVHTDVNCLSVIQYAVEVLKVKHVLVVGHYGCGGVQASIGDEPLGLIDNWLRHIRNVYKKHQTLLSAWSDEQQRLDRLCELNAIEQARNVCETTVVQEAWRRGQSLTVHAWVYGLEDGLVNDLEFSVDSNDMIDDQMAVALRKIETMRDMVVSQGKGKEKNARSLWLKINKLFGAD